MTLGLMTLVAATMAGDNYRIAHRDGTPDGGTPARDGRPHSH